MSETPRRILVVDDESHITGVLAHKLRNAGFEVDTAADGEEALAVAREHPPSLVITDLQMPYLTGLELCERLKSGSATAGVPAIMLTARGHALSENDLARTNIRLVLSKPFSPRQVLEHVNGILGGSASAAPGSVEQSRQRRAEAA
ncbi:MAG TPA: response regulator [Phycisphaerales bacterium]|nr:response regulator [Phycisphaerales bacterium]